MGLIGKIEPSIENLEDFEASWVTYREITRNGIIGYSDSEIRELHGRLSYLLSNAEINLGDANATLASAQVKTKLKKSELLMIKYPDGPFNQRTAAVEGDEKYQEKLLFEGECESLVEIWKGQVHACQTAVELLSREISFRIKK